MTQRAWLGAGVIAGGALVLATVLRTLAGDAAAVSTALAQEGPFDLTIVETGALQALKSVSYASSIQSNQAKIVALAPEGKVVSKGDLEATGTDAASMQKDRRVEFVWP